jgi:hypothetical protein
MTEKQIPNQIKKEVKVKPPFRVHLDQLEAIASLGLGVVSLGASIAENPSVAIVAGGLAIVGASDIIKRWK